MLLIQMHIHIFYIKHSFQRNDCCFKVTLPLTFSNCSAQNDTLSGMVTQHYSSYSFVITVVLVVFNTPCNFMLLS